MSTSYTTTAKLQKPAYGDRNWHTPVNANADTLDGFNAIGDLCVTLAETPSASLNVAVAAGSYLKPDGTIGSYAGTATFALTASNTNYVYLDAAGALQKSTSAFPTNAANYPLAVVVVGTSTITSIADARVPFTAVASPALLLAGGTLADAANIALGTTTGTKIGTATTQKIGFFNATPVVQPSGAAQAALTDSTTGTAGTTLADVGASFTQATLNNNFASLANLLNKLRTDLVALGLIKGSA